LYNEVRSLQGRYYFGTTPMQKFGDAIRIVREKSMLGLVQAHKPAA